MFFLIMVLLGFFGGGFAGKFFFEGFYPAAWIGLAIGIVLWLLFRFGVDGSDALDAFGGFDD